MFSELVLIISAGILMSLSIFPPGEVRGEESIRKISLSDCIQLALDNPETTDSIYYEVDLAEIELDQTDSLFYPHIGARYNYDYDFKEDDVYSGIELLLSGSYLQVPQNIVRRKIAEAKLKAAEYKSQRERFRLIYTITSKYCELLKLQAFSSRSRSLLTIAEMQKKIADIQRREGLTLEPELKEIGRKIISLKGTLESSQRSLREARSAFSRFLSIEGDYNLEPLEHLPSLSADPKELIGLAQENRSDARACRELIELLKSSITLAVLDRWLPEPELELGYGSPTAGEASDWFEKEGFYVRTALSYTIWDWGEKASRIALAKRELENNLAALKALPGKIRLEVAESYAGLEKAWVDTENVLEKRKNALKRFQIFQALHEEEPASEYETSRAKLELQRAEWELTVATADETIARSALAKAVELEPDVLTDILSTPEAEIESLPAEAEGQ